MNNQNLEEENNQRKAEVKSCKHNLLFSTPGGIEKYSLTFCKGCSKVVFARHDISFCGKTVSGVFLYKATCTLTCQICSRQSEKFTNFSKLVILQTEHIQD
jgi:hypothetical protein